MRILVDADACPVIDIIIDIAKSYNLEVILYCDTSHILNKEYAKVIMCDKGADSVDFYLINNVLANDIVVSQDYGVLSMALAKKAYAINQNGLIFNENNITSLLEYRALSKKIRMSNNKNHLKGPKKRTILNDNKFKESLILLIKEVLYDK